MGTSQSRQKFKLMQHTGYKVPNIRLEPIARILLLGTYDDDCILSRLRGMRFIVKAIWKLALEFNKVHYALNIKRETSFKLCLTDLPTISFPPPQNININMMPFLMATEFKSTKLPKYLQHYFKALILPCLRSDPAMKGTICFLTIQESEVAAGCTQRRPGLHIESAGNDYISSKLIESGSDIGKLGRQIDKGCGHYDDEKRDGGGDGAEVMFNKVIIMMEYIWLQI